MYLGRLELCKHNQTLKKYALSGIEASIPWSLCYKHFHCAFLNNNNKRAEKGLSIVAILSKYDHDSTTTKIFTLSDVF